jgi:hypothetical protein
MAGIQFYTGEKSSDDGLRRSEFLDLFRGEAHFLQDRVRMLTVHGRRGAGLARLFPEHEWQAH